MSNAELEKLSEDQLRALISGAYAVLRHKEQLRNREFREATRQVEERAAARQKGWQG